jgi:endoglucanase
VVALDVTYATDVPGEDAATGGHHVLGGGPAIFRGPAVNPRVLELLLAAAREEGIDHTVEVGAKTYTDADVTFASREGIPTALVSIPLRNMHSPIEIVQLDDLESCIRLLVAFARKLEPGASYAR